MHCTAAETDERREALGYAAALLADETVDLESLAFVFDGPAVKGARAESEIADEIRGVLARDPDRPDAPRVEVVACRGALSTRGVDDDELVAGVEVVDSGVGELTRRQAEGYAYIRVP